MENSFVDEIVKKIIEKIKVTGKYKSIFANLDSNNSASKVIVNFCEILLYSHNLGAILSNFCLLNFFIWEAISFVQKYLLNSQKNDKSLTGSCKINLK